MLSEPEARKNVEQAMRTYEKISGMSPADIFVARTSNFPNCDLAWNAIEEWITTNKSEGSGAVDADDLAIGWAAIKDDVVNQLGAEASQQFIDECPSFYASRYNGDLLLAHAKMQIGNAILTAENLHASFEHLQKKGMFEKRPAPEPTMADRALAGDTAEAEPRKKSAAEIRAADEAEQQGLRAALRKGKLSLDQLKELANNSRRAGEHSEKFFEENPGVQQRVSNDAKKLYKIPIKKLKVLATNDRRSRVAPEQLRDIDSGLVVRD